MGHLQKLSRRGIRVSIRRGDVLWLDPQYLVTPEIAEMVRSHKDDLLAEIRSCAGTADGDVPEIVPDYHFLWVATDLDSFEEYDPRFRYEVNCEPVFRMLDAPYYAWLRHRMENAKKAHDAGRLDDVAFETLRGRFNIIHEWAVRHIGEHELRLAVRTTNVKTYVPPSEATVAAYRKTWDDAWDEHRKRNRASTVPVTVGTAQCPPAAVVAQDSRCEREWDYICARCGRKFKLRGEGEMLSYHCTCGYFAKVAVRDIPKLLAYEELRERNSSSPPMSGLPGR